MELPILVPSISTLTETDDGLLSNRLLLANHNRMINSNYRSDFSCLSPIQSGSGPLRGINFAPEVSVRFFRPRSSTGVSLADSVGSGRSLGSPFQEDVRQPLKGLNGSFDFDPSDDDEDYSRFYNSMVDDYPIIGFTNEYRRITRNRFLSDFS
jgi:hypothetical protein